jgi:hypothetical protein
MTKVLDDVEQERDRVLRGRGLSVHRARQAVETDGHRRIGSAKQR